MTHTIYYRGYVIYRRVDRVEGRQAIGAYWCLTPDLKRLEAPTLKELKLKIQGEAL